MTSSEQDNHSVHWSTRESEDDILIEVPITRPKTPEADLGDDSNVPELNLQEEALWEITITAQQIILPMEIIVQDQIRCPMLHLVMQGVPSIPRKLSLTPNETVIFQTGIMVILNYEFLLCIHADCLIMFIWSTP